VSNLLDLQKQLHNIMRKHPNLRIATEYPWDPTQFESIIGVLQDYASGIYGDFDTEELSDWLDRYRFHRAGNRTS
jgi:hypothetical protein